MTADELARRAAKRIWMCSSGERENADIILECTHLAELVELRRYAKHRANCMSDVEECTCGLDALLKAIDEK